MMLQKMQLFDIKSQIIKLIGNLLSYEKIEETNIRYVSEILTYIQQSNISIVKLKILNYLLLEMLEAKKEGYELFHSYQSPLIIFQMPDIILYDFPIIFESFKNYLLKEELLNISDCDKILILIERFILKPKAKIGAMKCVKKED